MAGVTESENWAAQDSQDKVFQSFCQIKVSRVPFMNTLGNAGFPSLYFNFNFTQFYFQNKETYMQLYQIYKQKNTI